jgi:hypothetical protein
MRPRLQSGACTRPLSFTVRRLSVPSYNAIARLDEAVQLRLGQRSLAHGFIVRAFGVLEVRDMLTDIAHEQDRLIFG